jgi:hypothetical protein
MKRIETKNKFLAIAVAAAMTIGTFQLAQAVPATSGVQTTPPTQGGHGTNRGGSYPVKAIVKLGDQPVAGVTVTATAKNSATAVTDENGIAAFLLVPGSYTFTATNDSGTATASAKVVASTTPLVVQLPLAPKAQ